jgi:hypothetical protein
MMTKIFYFLLLLLPITSGGLAVSGYIHSFYSGDSLTNDLIKTINAAWFRWQFLNRVLA